MSQFIRLENLDKNLQYQAKIYTVVEGYDLESLPLQFIFSISSSSLTHFDHRQCYTKTSGQNHEFNRACIDDEVCQSTLSVSDPRRTKISDSKQCINKDIAQGRNHFC